MSIFTATANRIAGLFGYVRASSEEQALYDNRSQLYAVNEMLYSGSVYRTRTNGGALDDVLKTYIGSAYNDVNKFPIYPFFLPFKEIVKAYGNVLPGTWGKGIKPADTFDGKPINPKLSEPLQRIWRDSNLDTNKAEIIRCAANLGTVGLRVVASESEGSKPARAAIDFDPPSRLFNFEQDKSGNVTAVVLKYKLTVNRGTLADPDFEQVEVVEQIDKDGFSVTHDGRETLKDANRANRLGFCPYVILRHETSSSSPYGEWAYKGIEDVVHRINWLISRQDKSILRHMFPHWFGAAGGKPSTVDLDMGDTKMTYAQTAPDTPPPILQAIVPDLNQVATQTFWTALCDQLRGRNPELNLNDVKLLGNTSGEALAQVLKPTENVILEHRPAYDHAFIRALQMGVSAGVVVGAWDVGTGTGSTEAADRAYREGMESFEFAHRPALPETPQQRTVNAAADVADRKAKADLAAALANAGVSQREQLRVMGYDDIQVATIEGEKALEQAEAALTGAAGA